MKHLRPLLLAAALWAGIGTALANPAAAPLSNASVEDLVQRLSVSDGAFKAFRPTRAPGADHQCAGNLAPPAGSPQSHKNFAVEYADDTEAQVDLAVQFEINSDRLQPAGQELLRTLAAALNSPKLAQERFAVAGHTDSTGPVDLNLRLSCARAIAVRNFLVQAGVAPSRVWAYGFGPNRLLKGHEATSPVHRRVEIRRAPG